MNGENKTDASMSSQSEVARIRRQIEVECEAFARMFDAPAIVASHAAINARYQRMNELQEELVGVIGAQAATELVVTVYKEIIG